jgi:transcriptional regulator with XRE-family HTH domain
MSVFICSSFFSSLLRYGSSDGAGREDIAMATVECGADRARAEKVRRPARGGGTKPALHRIREVRRQQRVSLRSASRRMGLPARVLRAQESVSANLRISDLQRWQAALDVPIADLLVESSECLSRPVLDRARLVRLMKTAAAIRELARSRRIARLAEMLSEQLVEIMPELKEVAPWHSVGQRRTLDEYGRIVERQIPVRWLSESARQND